MRILLYNPDNGVTRNFMPHLWMFLLKSLTPPGHEVLLIRLTEHLRMRHRGHGPAAPGLRHLTVVEEAHRLLRNSQPGQRGAAAHAVEMFAALLAEIRAYGAGLIIAEQIPAKLIPDGIKNTAVKIVHRLPAADDREAVGATMNLTDDQSQYLVTLAPGEAAGDRKST